MNVSRRRVLQLSATILGPGILDFLRTPAWRWSSLPVVEAAATPAPPTTQGSAPQVQFVDVAREAGLTTPNVWGGVDNKKYIIEAKGSGIAFFDYDQDGWLDIYLTNGSRLFTTWPEGKAPTTQLYRNNRDGTFTDVTAKSGLGRSGWQTGVCVGDYDNDGWDDLFCTFWGHNILFRNNGNGTFTDVTRHAGLWEDEVRWGSGCTWIDYDRDGFLDLFVANYLKFDPSMTPAPGDNASCQYKGEPVMCGPRGLPPGTNLMYRNNGDGTFTDVSEKSGILKTGPRTSITAVSYDFDNDGWPDIYVAVDSGPSILFHNNHDGTFTDIAVASGCGYSDDGHEQAGMGVGVGDYDCDGWFDIFKTNFSEDTSNLYHNNGDGTFTEVTAEAGVAQDVLGVKWGCGFIDYDNDGWPDIFQVDGHVYPGVDEHSNQTFLEPRVVYRNLGNRKFQDVSKEMGPGITARHSSRGCAFGDFDNDGDIDVVVNNMNEIPSLLRNDGGNQNNWIKVKLIGTKCNRTALGACVRVTTGKHTQMDEVHSGTSVMSQSDLRLHFGVGQVRKIDRLEVKWPTTQKVEVFSSLDPNQILVIKEGSGIIQRIPPNLKPK
ncbi:MAG: CRTAC1 family protein [Terracidiphilus sp.]